jgi:hypothetical protein
VEIIAVAVSLIVLYYIFDATLSKEAKYRRTDRKLKQLAQERAEQRRQEHEQLVIDRRFELIRERELLKGTGKVPFVDWEESFLATHTVRFRRPSPPRAKPAGWSVDWDRERLLKQEGLCFWCGNSLGGRAHRDHVYPLASGGANDVSNLVMACPPCNLDKSSKHPLKWLAITKRIGDERKIKLAQVIGNSDVSVVDIATESDLRTAAVEEVVEFDIVQLNLFDE